MWSSEFFINKAESKRFLFMSTNFVESFESFAATTLDNLADAIVGKPSTLRNGTEHHAVELPRDLYAHNDAQTEWWYYTGHMQTEAGRRFGFELVFFKRRTDLDRFGVVPLRLFANPIYFAHFAISDESSKQFRYEHRKSTNGPFDSPAINSTKRYYLKLGEWTIREAHGMHLLRATLGGGGAADNLVFEVALNPTKPVSLNGEHGVSFKDHGEASRYFAYTRMKAEGDITWHGRTEHFTGTAWMDREFGTWNTENHKGWDWFSLQLANNSELMVYHLRDDKGLPSSFSSGTYIDPAGQTIRLTHDDFALEVTGYWRSPHTDATYPSGWRLQVPRIGIDVEIKPVIKDQELDTRGTTMIVYWEGVCTVEGRHGEESTSGRAYAELVGYDRSHEQPSITGFLFGGAFDQRWRSIFG